MNFQNFLKIKLKEIALHYLLKERGTKGKEIIYNNLEMADYLLPLNDLLSIEEKRNMFSTRNWMVDIADNFGKKRKVFLWWRWKYVSCIHLWINQKSRNHQKNLYAIWKYTYWKFIWTNWSISKFWKKN